MHRSTFLTDFMSICVSQPSVAQALSPVLELSLAKLVRKATSSRDWDPGLAGLAPTDSLHGLQERSTKRNAQVCDLGHIG